MDIAVGSGDATTGKEGQIVVFARSGDVMMALAGSDNRMRRQATIGGLLFALSALLAGAGPSAAGPVPPPPAAQLGAPAATMTVTRVASHYYTPQKGSAERRAIMDAARVPVSADIGQTVIFRVSVLRTDGDWAYLQAEPRNPDGSALDWSRTRFAQDWAMDAMSDVIMVLLRRSGSGFQVVDRIIGPTDVAWYEWLGRYGLPEALFYDR